MQRRSDADSEKILVRTEEWDELTLKRLYMRTISKTLSDGQKELEIIGKTRVTGNH